MTHIAEVTIKPPAKYPYLYPLIYAMLGFIVFTVVFVQSNLFMINEFNKSRKKIKIILNKED